MIGFYIAGAYMMLDTALEANGSKFDLLRAWRDHTRGAIFSLSLVVVLGLIALYQTVV